MRSDVRVTSSNLYTICYYVNMIKYAFSAHMRYILYYVWAASLYRVLLISRDGCYSAAADVRVYNGRFLCVFFSPSLIGTCGGHAHAAESQKRFR